MKKVVAILLAGVLTLGLSMTAFAADSPSADTDETVLEATVTDGVGNVVVSTTYATEEEAAAVEALAADSAATLESVVGAEAASGLTLATVMDVTVENWDGNPITISFAYPGVTADSSVIVLHYTNGAWVQEACTLSAGYIAVTFTSFSPVAIYVDESTVEATEEEAEEEAEEETTASSSDDDAEVGDSAAVPFAFLLAALAVCGLVVSVRSYKKNRA